MKRVTQIIYYLLVSQLILVSYCAVIEPDTQKPEVKLVSPSNEVVVGDSLHIRVTASDNEGIEKIEYYFDAKHDSSGDDYEKPYEHQLDLSQFSLILGSPHTLFAKAFDETDNEMISNFVTVYYKWIELIEDDNESFKRDINKIYVRNTETSLQLRIEYNGEWSDPYQRLSGMNCAVFLDTDLNSNTGLPQDTVQTYYKSYFGINDSLKYSAGDISPEYLIVIGVEGNGIWKWDQNIFGWVSFGQPQFVTMVNDTNYFEIGVNLTDLQIQDTLDVVAANITFSPDTSYWDWVPNNGHLRYIKDSGFYIGE
ncbi:hypothetical protein GF337_02750 [candidate division KSB1 bacterium]|nr:hypothetical protein [candidate division KSB1 bacterium]